MSKVTDHDTSDQPAAGDQSQKAGGKKAYETPVFRFERVFEVSALACGKLSSTEENCRVNRKVS